MMMLLWSAAWLSLAGLALAQFRCVSREPFVAVEVRGPTLHVTATFPTGGNDRGWGAIGFRTSPVSRPLARSACCARTKIVFLFFFFSFFRLCCEATIFIVVWWTIGG